MKKKGILMHHCKDCGGDLGYIGDAVIGNETELHRKTSLWACKICNRVYRGAKSFEIKIGPNIKQILDKSLEKKLKNHLE